VKAAPSLETTVPEPAVPRVLVVEDSPTQATKLQAILEDAGLEVVLAGASEQALTMLEALAIDLVICDIVMPGMSGYDLCRHIKSSPAHSSLPVVLLSAHNEPMDIIRGLECGADGFLPKPYQPAQIVDRVRTIFENRELRSAACDGVQIVFLGQRFTITSRTEQILDLLISTFEDAVWATRELQRHEAELAVAKSTLEKYTHSLESRVQVSADEALTELARTNAELNQQLAQRTIERDYVARHEALAELARTNMVEKDSEEKFRGFLTASPDPMLVVDEAGCIVIASRRSERLFGYLQDQLVGQPASLLIPERFRALHDRNVRVLLGNPADVGMGVGSKQYELQELFGLRQDGSEFPLEMSLSPHRTSTGSVLIVAMRDVSMRKQTEAALQQAQKMEAVGHLTSGVAHDFNNVLGAVIGNLDLLAEVIVDNPKAVHHAEQSLAAALSGAELVKRMLAFSRRQPLHLKPLDLRATMASVVPLIRRTLSEQIVIVETLVDDLWLAIADSSQIENAVLNLAINSRDAMPDGGTLTIDCRNATVDETYAPAYGTEFQPGDYIVISVTDTGNGMAADVVARAFDPFFTTKEQGVGTGLGLSMVFGTMKQSGGTARIYSEPGQGTTVQLYLPRTTIPVKSENGHAIDAVVPSRGNERVLVVEDNERIRDVSCTILADLGYRIEAVDSADEALARIASGSRFELVFSDVVMPGTHTGLTLARALRTLDQHLKIVLTSGYTSPGKFQDELTDLGIELISKPFRKAELATLIRRVLDEPESP
jgi:hypothetical protein